MLICVRLRQIRRCANDGGGAAQEGRVTPGTQSLGNAGEVGAARDNTRRHGAGKAEAKRTGQRWMAGRRKRKEEDYREAGRASSKAL